MEDIPIMQKTVLKPSKIPALRDHWLNYDIEQCHDCKGTLFYIRPTKGIVYDKGFLNGKIANGNIYHHFMIDSIGFHSVCAECGSSNSYLTKVDDDWVVEEFKDSDYNTEWVKQCLEVIDGENKNPGAYLMEEARLLKHKIDEWIERHRVEDPYTKKEPKPKSTKKKSKK